MQRCQNWCLKCRTQNWFFICRADSHQRRANFCPPPPPLLFSARIRYSLGCTNNQFSFPPCSFKVFAAAFGEVEIDVHTICNCECQDDKVNNDNSIIYNRTWIIMVVLFIACSNQQKLMYFHLFKEYNSFDCSRNGDLTCGRCSCNNGWLVLCTHSNSIFLYRKSCVTHVKLN